MIVSVIIPTYNGAKKIKALLDSLLLQSFHNFEVVVAIDGSTDNTQKEVERYRSAFQDLTIVVQQNRGRAATRNFGATKARGELFVFVDDDMVLEPNAVQQHVKFHQQVTHALLTGNQVELIEDQKTDLQNYKATLTSKWTKKYADGLTELHSKNIFFTGALCSIKRSDFLILNGFDERLRDAEDFDLGLRALACGYHVYFDKTCVGYHNDPITCTSYIKRLREYKKAHLTLSDLYPDRRSVNEVRPLSNLGKFFYFFFSFSFWPTLVDRTSVLHLLPKVIRFKLYDWIIFASVNMPSREVVNE